MKGFKVRKGILRIALLSLIGILFVWAAVRIARWIDYPNTDFFSYWLGARTIWSGESPYDETLWVQNHHLYGATWISDLAYLYPLPLALLTAPLGLLPLKASYITWIILSEIMIAASIWILLRLWGTAKYVHYVFPVFAGVILFRPVILTLVGGQLGAALLLVTCLAIWLWKQGRWFTGGMLLSLLVLKPNTGVLILAFVLLWLFANQKWRALAGMALAGIILLGIGLVYDPAWVNSYLVVGNRKVAETFGYSPTLWGMASGICNFRAACALITGSILVTPLAIATLIVIFRKQFNLTLPVSFSLILSVVLLVTPYIWPYDQILLIIPVVVAIEILAQSGVKFIITANLFLILDLVALGLLVITARIEKEIWNAAIPLICLGLVVYSAVSLRKAGSPFKGELPEHQGS